MGTGDTQATLRRQLKTIKRFGVTQRALAQCLDVDESWLSRWLRDVDEPRAITVPEMDRFRAYVREFARALNDAQRSDPSEDTNAARKGQKVSTQGRASSTSNDASRTLAALGESVRKQVPSVPLRTETFRDRRPKVR